MLQAVTRPQEGQYGIAAGPTFALAPGSQLLAIFRVPNNWRLDTTSGRLLKDLESEEFKAVVGFARDLWQLGVWHPDTPTHVGGPALNDLVAGRFAVLPNPWGTYVQLWDVAGARSPNERIYAMHPFAFDGGKPRFLAGSGNFGLTYIKQQRSPERLKMLLRVANFFAAPFGSTEWLLNYFGAQDVDFTFDEVGAPKLTGQGQSELTAVWRYVTSPAYALFSAYRSQEFATVSHAAEEAMLAALEMDPTQGLYSPTAAADGVLAQDTLMSGVSDIVLSRRPLTDLDGLVADWRTRAGDTMRAEFQDALQKA
jgi:putative aldouronate transport system substrate-binding protein